MYAGYDRGVSWSVSTEKPVEEGAQRTQRSREDLSGALEVEVHGAVFTAGGKSLRNTSGEAAR